MVFISCEWVVRVERVQMFVIVYAVPAFAEDVIKGRVVFSKFSKEGEGSANAIFLGGY